MTASNRLEGGEDKLRAGIVQDIAHIHDGLHQGNPITHFVVRVAQQLHGGRDHLPDTVCQWTRIVTRLVDPNCYEARPSPDRAASSRTALESPWFPGRSCTSPRILLVPATPNRGQ